MSGKAKPGGFALHMVHFAALPVEMFAMKSSSTLFLA
jgi:hypothetical protein